MAKPVKLGKGKEFVFKTAGSGKVSQYPWDEWFTGDLLLLERSIVDADGKVASPKDKRDFDVDVNFMPAKLKTAARRRYKVVQVSRTDADGHKLKDSLIIRARDMTPDERAAEDLLRAEEKAKAAERRAEAKDDEEGEGDDTQPQPAGAP